MEEQARGEDSTLPGETVGRFHLEAELGRGGMGRVYRALDTKLGRKVALKLLPRELMADTARRGRFLREARLAAAVEHENVATVFEVGEADGAVFIAMELVRGETLSALARRQPLPTTRALALALEIARALEAAHAVGVVHRDLKPGNVMVSEHGRVKLVDFGLAKSLEPPSAPPDGAAGLDATEPHTLDRAVLGTPAYMSPEQCRGEAVDHRTDIFAFGVLLFELCAGRRPFAGGTSAELMVAIMNDPAPALAEIAPSTPADVARLVGRCLEKRREDRVQSASELVRVLSSAVTSSAASTAPAAPGASAARSRATRTALFAAAAIGVIGLVGWRALDRGQSAQVGAAAASADGGRTPVDGGAPGGASTLVEARRITGYPPSSPVFYSTSRDGRWLVRTSFADGLLMEPLAGGRPRKLPVQRNYRYVGPIDGPVSDGKRLLVIGLDGAHVELGLLDVETGALTVLQRAPADARPLGLLTARISPDEQRIVFTGTSGLSVMSIDGSNERLLVPFDAKDVAYAIDWSPDGRFVAFIQDRPLPASRGWDTKLRIVAAGGGAVTTLPTNGNLNQRGGVHAVAWRDQQHLVYAAAPRPGAGSELWEIGVAGDRWDGQPQRRLHVWSDASVDNLRKAGPRLLYLQNVVQTDVHVIDLDTTGALTPQRATNQQGMDLITAWTPDERLLIESDRHGSWDLLALPWRGGEAEVLASGPDVEAGGRISGDSLLFWRVAPGPEGVDLCTLHRRRLDGGEPVTLVTLDSVGYPEPGPPTCPAVGCPAGRDDLCFLNEREGDTLVMSWFDPRAQRLERRPTSLDLPQGPGALSPDGTTIAVLLWSQRPSIEIIPVDGGDRRTIALELRGEAEPLGEGIGWHQAGGWVLWGRSDTDQGQRLHVAHVDASGRQAWRKSVDLGTFVIQPMLSASGRRIAYTQIESHDNVWALDGLWPEPAP